MDIRQMKLVMLMILIFMLITIKHANAVTASVYAVTSNPVFTETGVSTTTITKGYTAANQAVYKATVQTVEKGLFLSTLRKGLAFTPWGIGALAAWTAYDYYIDSSTGDLMYTPSDIDWSSQSSSGVTGTCRNGTNNWGSLTLEGCFSLAQQFSKNFMGVDLWAGTWPTYPATDVYWIYTSGTYSPPVSDPVIVSDDLLYQQIQDYVTNNPTVDHSQLFYGSDGQIEEDFFPSPDFNLVTPEDQVLIDLYGSGLLQSTDPLAANYVTPEEYQRIADLHAEQNKTPEQQADELTADSEKPLTRTEYADEQALKEARMEASADSMSNVDLSGLDKTTEMNDQWDILDSMINNPAGLPSGLPTVPQLPFTSSCQTIELGYSKVFPTPNQCSQLNTAKELVGYFLYVVFFWLILIELFKEAN